MLLGRFDQHKINGSVTGRKRRLGFAALAAFLIFAAFVLLRPDAVHAGVNLGLQYATGIGLTTTDIRTVVARIINAFFALLGLVAVVLFLYAGFLWMTASGNEEKIVEAKRIMVNTTIGLVIMLSAYAITWFIYRAITGENLTAGGAPSGGPQAALTSVYCPTCGPEELGNGIVQYHYPEVGQTGVYRNTTISITFKKPLLLSTVIKTGLVDGTRYNYCDFNKLNSAEHKLCTDCAAPSDATCKPVTGAVLELNTDNIKIIRNDKLAASSGSNPDENFVTRYSANDYLGATAGKAPYASVTQVPLPLDPDNGAQTIVITPVDWLGDQVSEINYRVGLRGGENGIKVWAPAPDGGTQTQPAFSTLRADGSYYWSFTTSTTADTTPPMIEAFVPRTAVTPADRLVDRNQLLQVYFNEGVNPVTASGLIGGTSGFNNVDIQARCLAGKACVFGCDRQIDATSCAGVAGGTCAWDAGQGVCRSQCQGKKDQSSCTGTSGCQWFSADKDCGPNTTDSAVYYTVAGTLSIGNSYKTIEFKPSTRCDGILENSCGDPVYCLPKNVDLRVVVKAAHVDPAKAPAALAPVDGVTDLANNSFDGNGNGKAEGPGTISDAVSNSFTLNQRALVVWGDTAGLLYRVGTNIDLIPPKIVDILPRSASSSTPAADTPYNEVENQEPAPPGGPSKVPGNLPVKVLWSKVISIGSLISGKLDDKNPEPTVILQAKEWKKKNANQTCNTQTPCLPDTALEKIGAPFYTLGVELKTNSQTNEDYSNLIITHRQFYTSNELGWTEADAADAANYPVYSKPLYFPTIRARIKDDKQNCFYPSQGYGCADDFGQPTSPTKSSCCDRQAVSASPYNCAGFAP